MFENKNINEKFEQMNCSFGQFICYVDKKKK